VLGSAETVQKYFSLQELLSINFIITLVLGADCLENVGASMSHIPVGLHGLLHGYLYLFYLLVLVKSVVKYSTNHYNSCKEQINISAQVFINLFTCRSQQSHKANYRITTNKKLQQQKQAQGQNT
jgi:hypothetical protein